MEGMLAGVTVLDLSTVGPGSRCTALLRDLGATVVKVGAPASASRIEPAFHAYGAARRMKRARIDLRAPEGRDAFLRLVAGADAVVESYRPGVAGRLGIGYEACRTANPRIVYAAVTGYGQDGPYAQRAGHDVNYLAMGGFLSCQGRAEGGGPAIPGATVADSAGGGMHAALSICAALVRRGATGEGAFLDVSTTDGVLLLMSLALDEYLATGEEWRPGSTLLLGRYACYDLYAAGDGRWLAVGAIEPRFFANLCRALACEEWIPHHMDDARQAEIRAAFGSAFAGRTRDEWVDRLAGADTCVTPVLSVPEVVRDPHLVARGAFGDAEHPEHGRFRQLAPVLAGSAPAAPVERAVPASESHTRALLAAAGVSDAEIGALVERGIVE